MNNKKIKLFVEMVKMKKKFKLIIFLLLIFSSKIISAQEVDTIPKDDVYIAIDTTDEFVHVDSMETIEIDTTIKKTKNPRLALFLSMGVPGLGQIYVGKYWKVPIIYTVFGTGGYFIYNSHVEYKKYLNDLNNLLRYQMHIDTLEIGEERTIPEPIYETAYNDEQTLTKYKDRYRRQRDLTLFIMVAFWSLNIIDAYVDAHFYSFDVSEDLSFKFEPIIMNSSYAYNPTFGIKFSLKF